MNPTTGVYDEGVLRDTVGRTARGANDSGRALLFLTPEEADFLGYLKAAKVSLDGKQQASTTQLVQVNGADKEKRRFELDAVCDASSTQKAEICLPMLCGGGKIPTWASSRQVDCEAVGGPLTVRSVFPKVAQRRCWLHREGR